MSDSSSANELVVLVNENDEELGTMEKMAAHENGALHRAFSVFVFNSNGELMLQRRAATKYHSPGLWTNTCCSHPRLNELVSDAASRRLKEEMGMSCSLIRQFSFVYKAKFSNGLTEHELDHVFFGVSDNEPLLNHEEADAWRYVSIAALKAEIAQNEEGFTPWLRICLDEVVNRLSENPILT